MAKTLSGWSRVGTFYKSGDLAQYKETIKYGSGNVVDCYGSEFGDGVSTEGVPQPPPGVDWTVMFIQNNTMSAAGDIVLQGAETSGGTFATLKDDLVAFAAATTAAGFSTVGTYVQQPGLTPTGGRTPVFRFWEDDDGLHSTSIGAEKTSEIHIMWIIP
jgi:hypothetical protein